MKNWIIPVLVLFALIAIFGFQKSNKPQADSPEQQQVKEEQKENQMSNLSFPGILADEKIKNKKAIIKTSKGTIEFELLTDKAPKTVSNFVYLTENKFYNNLNFHRVVPGFVIQGGDPKGNGTGGPGYQFEDEPVQGDYKKGTVAMANSGPNTNGSQFFICLEDQTDLPKNYSLFGQVISGIDVVEKIQVGDKIEEIRIENK